MAKKRNKHRARLKPTNPALQPVKLQLCNSKVALVFVVFKVLIAASMLVVFYNFAEFHQANLWNRRYAKSLHDWYLPFTNWDGQHYLWLANAGYGQNGAPAASAAFFPLLPLLVKGVAYVLGNIYAAAIVVNLLCSYLFACFFYRYASHYLPAKQALKSLVLVLTFPSAFYLTVFYNEALFLLVLFAFLYFYQLQKSYYSVLFALLMPLVRGQALFVMAAVVAYALWQLASGKDSDWRYLLSNIAGFVAGGVLYGLIFYFATGSFFSGIDAQQNFVFGNSLANVFNPAHFLQYLFSPSEGFFAYNHATIDKIFIVGFLLSIILVIRAKLGLAAMVYLAVLYFPAAMGAGGSFVRFSLLGSPILAIALLKLYPKAQYWFYLLCLVFLALQIFLAGRFGLNLWVG